MRWTVAIVAAALASLALAVPLLGRDHWLAAWSITQFFSFACHQAPARSLWIAGAPVAVCARCFGIYLGAAAGAWIRMPRRVGTQFVIVTAAANTIDVALELAGLHGSWPAARFALGTSLGAAVASMM